MNYKELFRKTWLLSSAPYKAWEEILHEKEEESTNVQGGYVYPMIALCGVADFLGTFFDKGVDNSNLHLMLVGCCSIIVSLFGGFFLSVYLIEIYGRRFAGRPLDEREIVMRLVGYSMSILFVLGIFEGLFPSFLILKWIFQFYLVYLVWEGSKVLLQISEERLLSYTLVVSIIILLSPVLIGGLFEWISQYII